MSYFLTINDIHTQPWGKILFLMRKIMSTLSISPEEAPQVSASIYSVLLSSVPVHRVECWLLFTSVAQLWQSQAWVSGTIYTHNNTPQHGLCLSDPHTFLALSHMPCVISHQSCHTVNKATSSQEPGRLWIMDCTDVQWFNGHAGNGGWTCIYADKNIIIIHLFVSLKPFPMDHYICR